MTVWVALPDAEAVARRACEAVSGAAQAAVAARGEFSLVLAGGRTPGRTYELLCETRQDWPAWSLYYGDERCLPQKYPERNSRMVENTGLARKAGRHHPIPSELGPERAAAAYSETIRNALPFDMVMLGMGEDGHTASLFPGHSWPQEAASVPVHAAPKPPQERVSLTPSALQSCRAMLVLVTGESKRDALEAWRAGEPLPIAQVASVPHATVLVEQALLEGVR